MRILHRCISIVALFTLLLAAGCSFPVETAGTPPEDVDVLPATVVRVVDGDTVKVAFAEGKEETVRLLLVDTPETVHPDKDVEPFGPEASAFAKRTLAGQKVGIELDVSERDRYGRLLAYIWIGDRLFNEMLLEEGLARVAYVYPPNIKYVDQFRDVQKQAQLAGKGMWSIEDYALEEAAGASSSSASTSTSTSASASASADSAGVQVEIVSVTSPVAAGDSASLSAKVAPGATADIDVIYKSGSSRAAGLEPKQADANGEVSWTWNVGSKTAAGSWTIIVSSGTESARTEFEVVAR